MRRRLTIFVGLLLLANGANSTSLESEQDKSGGQLIVQIIRILASKEKLDAEVHSALGSSLEFLFLQLKRSKTKSAIDALAQTVVLRIDAGGGESRTEAILSKGKMMALRLKTVATDDYRRLCRGSMVDVCMSEAEAAKHVHILMEALRSGRVVP